MVFQKHVHVFPKSHNNSHHTDYKSVTYSLQADALLYFLSEKDNSLNDHKKIRYNCPKFKLALIERFFFYSIFAILK